MGVRTGLRGVFLLESPSHVAVATVVLSVVVQTLTPVDWVPTLFVAAPAVSIAYLLRHPAAASNLERATGAGPVGWGLGVAVAAAGVGATYLLGSPEPFCDGWSYRGCMTAYGWASAVFVAVTTVATGVLAGGVGRYRLLSRTPVDPAEGVSEGRTAVVGRVEPAASTVESPVTGTDAVAYRRAVRRRRRFGAGPAEYHTREYDGDAVEFYVRDGSGRLLVLPGSLDDHLVHRFWPAETVDGDVDAGFRGGNDRNAHRQREWTLAPDEAVVVAGEASEVSRVNYPESVVVGLEGSVAVAPVRRDAVANEFRWRVFVSAGLLVLIGGGSFAVMLASVL